MDEENMEFGLVIKKIEIILFGGFYIKLNELEKYIEFFFFVYERGWGESGRAREEIKKYYFWGIECE